MKLIIAAVIVGIIALAIIVIYLISSGVFTAKRDLALERSAKERAEREVRLALRALYEIAGNQTGNPQATAMATLDQLQSDREVAR